MEIVRTVILFFTQNRLFWSTVRDTKLSYFDVCSSKINTITLNGYCCHGDFEGRTNHNQFYTIYPRHVRRTFFNFQVSIHFHPIHLQRKNINIRFCALLYKIENIYKRYKMFFGFSK